MVSGFGQAQSINLKDLELKQKKFEQVIRAYEDSLADVNYLLAMLQDGDIQNSEDITEELLIYITPSFSHEKKIFVPSLPESGHYQNNISEYTSASKAETNIAPEKISRSIEKTARRTKLTSSKIANPGKQRKPQTVKNYSSRRVGAICRDGTRSYATGRGACSHHGGVSYWLFE